MKKYLYPMIVIIVIGILSVEMYKQLNPNKAKSQRLECHQGVTVFERTYHKDLVASVKEAILAGNVELNSRVQKSEYMDTQLFTHISQKQIDEKILTRFEEEKTGIVSDKNVEIALLIYENDKEDPKKKTPAAKKYAGYLTFEYKIDKKVIYRFQIDFMDMQAKDIDSRIDCAVKSVMSI